MCILMYILSNITLFSCPEPGWWLPFASSRRRSLIRMGRCQHLVRSSSAESTFGGSFEHGSHVPVVCWKDFKKLFDKQALHKLGSNFGGRSRYFAGPHPSLTCWLNGSTAWVAIFGWRNRWKKSFLLFLHSLKPTVRPESGPGPRRKRSSYFQTLLFRSF